MEMHIKKEAIRRIQALQRVAGLVRKNIDVGERIGAFDRPVALRPGKEQFRPRRSRSIEEHPNLIFGGALNFGLREGNGCGLQVPEGAAGICGGCSQSRTGAREKP
jgi:hypothetical protein